METYLQYWRLSEPPFQNVSDTRFAFLSEQHHEGLARLMFLVQNRKLGGILTGPYGVGKSMILQLLAEHVKQSDASRFFGMDYLPGPILGLARQFLAVVGFPEQAAGLQDPMDAIRLLRDSQASLTHTVLALDEAQMIVDPAVYQFLRLLSNISICDANGRPLSPAFTLILSGYTQLARLLSADESLCQRLQMVWNLEPLDAGQTQLYIDHRLRAAGGDMRLYAAEALDQIFAASRGIPRLVNNICDVALMLGCAAGLRVVDEGIALQAISDVQSPLLNADPDEIRRA